DEFEAKLHGVLRVPRHGQSRHFDAQSVNHVPAKSVNYVPGLYTAAKKVTAAPHRGEANKPIRNRDPAKNLKPPH
ncbi:hypothetical protein, partial [Caballeronia arvi]|uniref:hypothetical protein n=1 Tax=Caballeronia arvi TaxID=1777135 RepID=UPI001F2ACE3C